MLKRLKARLQANPDGAGALIMRLLEQYARPNWKRYATVYVALAIAASCTAAFAFLIGSAINEAYVSRSYPAIVAISIMFMILFTVRGLATYGQSVLQARIGNSITAENQRRIFDKLMRQDLAFFRDRHSSEFSAQVLFASQSASNVLSLLISSLGRDVTTLVGLVTVMIIQDPFLSFIGIAFMLPSVLFLRHLIKRVRRIAETQFAGAARFLETLQETLQGLRVVKALNLETEVQRRAHKDVAEVEVASNKLARVMNRSTPLMEMLGGFAIAAIMLYSGYGVLVVNVPPGEFFSFMTAFLLAYEPGKRVARLNVDLNSALVGVRILFSVLDRPDQRDDPNQPALAVADGRVAFADVNFAYREGEPVLRGMSFIAAPGRMTALVGPSGGGKTTIFNLLLRFYDIQGGTITVDGTDIATVSRASVRQQISYVGQDVFLFRGTIRQNIAYGRLDATEEDIVAAAQAANAHEFIMAFPNGYDTPVGEHGLQLSGGQRQRVSVARALIRNTPIILLDEPTASLDGEAEQRVQAAIDRLSRGRTTLVIAHRLYTVTRADMIHVVEHGVIVESGRHDQLLRADGRYAEFYRLQFGGQDIAEERPIRAVSGG